MKHSLPRRNLRLFPALLVVGLLATAASTFAQPAGGPGTNGNQNNNRGDRSNMQMQMIARSLQSADYADEGLTEAVTVYVTNAFGDKSDLYQRVQSSPQRPNPPRPREGFDKSKPIDIIGIRNFRL